MSWRTTCPMNERLKFIADWLKKEFPVTALSCLYDISRKTAHKWIQRYKLKGLAGLEELDRAPKTHPQATPEAIEKRVAAFRREKPSWGPRKLLHRLRIIEPRTIWPCASTVGAILKRHGLAKKRRVRCCVAPSMTTLSVPQRPNDVWATDFKGWFRTLDRTRVDPLTTSDLASRFLLGCQVLVKPTFESVRQGFEETFRTYGLPSVIRSDNGWPFASIGLGGLSRLSVWWIHLGIRPERTRPAHPEENGSHERMHRNYKQDMTKPPKEDPAAQQVASDRFRREYNTERPHEALDMRTPRQDYRLSPRPFPNRLPEIAYGKDVQVRHVRGDGRIKWQGDMIFVSEVLTGEPVGMVPLDDDLWTLYFGPIPLALFDSRDKHFHKFERIRGKNV